MPKATKKSRCIKTRVCRRRGRKGFVKTGGKRVCFSICRRTKKAGRKRSRH